jgi:hypothetical protein
MFSEDSEEPSHNLINYFATLQFNPSKFPLLFNVQDNKQRHSEWPALILILHVSIYVYLSRGLGYLNALLHIL